MKRVGDHTRARDGEGHGSVAVCFGSQRRGMIGTDHNPVRSGGGQRLVQRPHDVTVDLLEGLDFCLRVAFMRSLIRRLDMYANQIGVGDAAMAARPLAA